MKKVAAVTFDLDGTLYDLARAKGPLLWATFPRWRTLRVGRRVREELRDESFADGADFLRREAEIAAERLGVDAAEARRRLDAVFDVALVKVLKRIGPRSEARAVLQAIVNAGLPIGVISDRGAVADKLRALGLDDVPFQALISADDVGAMKPGPRVFEAASSALGVAPSALLHVGDRDDSDGVGARGVGADFYLVESASTSPLLGVLTALGIEETP